jgi:hypothetical protein
LEAGTELQRSELAIYNTQSLLAAAAANSYFLFVVKWLVIKG